MKNKLIYALAATLLISCGGPAVTQLPQRSFPKVKLPSLIQDSAQAAEYLAQQLKEKCGVKEVVISYVGAVIGSHSGPGTLALFFLGSHR